MRFVALVIIGLFLAGQSMAGDEPPRAQVIAATKDAVANLTDEVYRASLTRSLSVGEFVQRTRSGDEFSKVLQRAQQIGGPRWIDDHTCQIELQISGAVVGQALKRIAAADPRRSPLSVNEVTRAVKDWDERSFSGTGAATSRLPAMKGRRAPHMGLQRDPWWDVSEQARDQAVAAARADAARRVIASVKPIPLTPKSDVGDVLAVKGVADGMQEFLVSQPAARVELNDNLEAEVELSATPGDTFGAFRDLAQKQKEVAVPADDQDWANVRDQFERRMATPIGRAPAAPGKANEGPAVVKPAALLPDRAPAWVGQRLEATGKASVLAKSKLMAARAAESAAEDKLRKQIEELKLDEHRTVGQAAKNDPRVDQAISRAVSHARIGRAEYQDNAAEVSVYLDLSEVWAALRDAQ
jgi:hypothetical protein